LWRLAIDATTDDSLDELRGGLLCLSDTHEAMFKALRAAR
jgi:hypothetical protein